MSPWTTACAIWRLGVLQALCWSYADEMGRLVAHCSCCGRPSKVLTTVFNIQASSSSQLDLLSASSFQACGRVSVASEHQSFPSYCCVNGTQWAGSYITGFLRPVCSCYQILTPPQIYVIFTEDVGQIPPANSIAAWFLEVMFFNIGMNTPCTAWTSPKLKVKYLIFLPTFFVKIPWKKIRLYTPYPSASFPSTWIFGFGGKEGKGPTTWNAKAVSRYRELRDRSNEVFGIHSRPMVNWAMLGYIGDYTSQLYRDYDIPFIIRTNVLVNLFCHFELYFSMFLLQIISIHKFTCSMVGMVGSVTHIEHPQHHHNNPFTADSGHGPSLSMESMFVGTSQDETGEDNE